MLLVTACSLRAGSAPRGPRLGRAGLRRGPLMPDADACDPALRMEEGQRSAELRDLRRGGSVRSAAGCP